MPQPPLRIWKSRPALWIALTLFAILSGALGLVAYLFHVVGGALK
jgi:hypothetical protein